MNLNMLASSLMNYPTEQSGAMQSECITMNSLMPTIRLNDLRSITKCNLY